MRPENTPDPRDPNAPIRYDDEAEDKRRGQVTLEELAEWWRTRGYPVDIAYVALELPKIPPERLAELRRRRDEILAQIRAEGGLLHDGE